MKRYEMVMMAKEAGICMGNSILLPAPNGQIEALEHFAALVAANEREECAKLCDKEVGELAYGGDDWYIAKSLALVIRARGET